MSIISESLQEYAERTRMTCTCSKEPSVGVKDIYSHLPTCRFSIALSKWNEQFDVPFINGKSWREIVHTIKPVYPRDSNWRS